MAAIGEGRYDEGIEHLERAYDILPHPNVLYNMGLAHMYAGRSDAALEFFTRYKETAPPSDAIEVDALIRSLQATPTPPPGPQEPTAPPAGELSNEQTIAAVEASAAEIRRLAEEQNSDALRKQADDLDKAVAKLREQGPAAQPEGPPTPVTPAEEVTATGTPQHGQIAQQTPPIQTGAQQARTGVYEEEVVSASRFSQSPLDAPNATAIITQQDIRMSGATGLSPLLRRIAGVEVTTVAPTHSEVSIRGLNRRSANKLLILWDGRPIRKEFLGTNWPDTLPISIDEIERIEVIRGPASALYGADAFSGIINIITRAPGTGDSFVSGRYGSRNMRQAVVSFNGRSGNAAYRFGTGILGADNVVRVTSSDRIDVRPFSDTPWLSGSGLTTSGQLDYTFAPGLVGSVGGSYASGDVTLQGLSRQGQVTVDDSYDSYAFANLATPVGIRVGAWYNRTFAISGQSYLAPGSFSRRDELTQDQAEVDISWNDTLKLLVPQTITVGATYRWKRMEWATFDDTHNQHHFGVYLQDVIQLAKPLRLQIGARMDRHPLLDKVQFSPRGSLVYRFFGEQSLRLEAGRAFRGPSFLESYLRLPNESPLRGVSAWGIGNPNLDPESITSIEIGYQNQESDYFTLEANVYYNWVKDAMLLTDVNRFTLRDYAGNNPLAAFDRQSSAFPVSSLSFANERATYRQIGGELGVRLFPIKGLDVYANYSIHDTQPIQKDRVDPVRAAEQQTSRHKVNTGFQYRAPIGFELSADLHWVGDQVWVEQVIDTERGVRWQEFDVDSLILLNARVGWRLFKERLELGVTGTNLTFSERRQHPFGQPFDTRFIGSAKVWF